jgi:general secretion pathway protein D
MKIQTTRRLISHRVPVALITGLMGISALVPLLGSANVFAQGASGTNSSNKPKSRAPVAAPAAAPADEEEIERSMPRPLRPSRFRGEPVTLNFVNADIEGVARAMSAILRQQFIVDPRVKGVVTLYSEDPLTPREAYLNFLSALRGLGFAVVESGGVFKVVPEADAKLQASTVSIGDVPRRGDQIITQIFRLNYENANNLVPVLRPLISPNNTINANPGNNTLIITDYADNLQRLSKIISSMDMPGQSEIEVVALRNSVASDIAPLVQRLADSPGSGPVGGPLGGANASSVLIDPRSNALVIRAQNAAKLSAIRNIIDKLDRPAPAGTPPGNIWVVYLKNADAVKLAAVLRAAYNVSGSSTSGNSPLSSSSPALTPSSTPGATSGANAPLNASTGPSTGGFIQADPSTNSLVITAPETIYRQLRSVIDQLDSRRAQVYIETMIVKVDASKAAEFGFQWQGISGQRGDRNIIGAGTNFSSGNSNILNLSAAVANGRSGVVNALGSGLPGGLNIGILSKISDFYSLGALARFLETNVGGNILSTPNLVALDNEEAKIVIGQNVPFITGSFTNTGSGNGSTNPFQTIERKDVGLTLKVKPQIGESGTVRMTIYQENSNVLQSQANSRTDTTGPTTEKSSIETTVVIDDGQIMVLGGLLKDEYTGNVGKVPFLGNLPLIGNLFKYDGRTRSKSNLMVFLRPIVLRTQEASNDLSINRYESIRAMQRESKPANSTLVPINDVPELPPLRLETQPGGSNLPLVEPFKVVPGNEPAKRALPRPASRSNQDTVPEFLRN